MGIINKIIIFIIVVLCLIIIIYWLILNNYSIKIKKLKKENTVLSISDQNNNAYKYLDYPLTRFYISTSHNTYLNGSQHLSFVSKQGIIDTLNLNARAIELDIHLVKNKIVIAHGNKDIITTTYMSLENALDTIYLHAFKNTNDPLILNIEIPDKNNIEFIKAIRQLILTSKIKDYLYLPDYEYLNSEKSYVKNDFTKVPIRNLLNKIIIIGDIDKYDILSDIVNKSNYYKNIDETNKYINSKKKEDNILSRVYKSGDIYSIFSINLDPLILFKNYHNMIALNFQMHDKNLYNYLNFFKKSSFILIE